MSIFKYHLLWKCQFIAIFTLFSQVGLLPSYRLSILFCFHILIFDKVIDNIRIKIPAVNTCKKAKLSFLIHSNLNKLKRGWSICLTIRDIWGINKFLATIFWLAVLNFRVFWTRGGRGAGGASWKAGVHPYITPCKPGHLVNFHQVIRYFIQPPA